MLQPKIPPKRLLCQKMNIRLNMSRNILKCKIFPMEIQSCDEFENTLIHNPLKMIILLIIRCKCGCYPTCTFIHTIWFCITFTNWFHKFTLIDVIIWIENLTQIQKFEFLQINKFLLSKIGSTLIPCVALPQIVFLLGKPSKQPMITPSKGTTTMVKSCAFLAKCVFLVPYGMA